MNKDLVSMLLLGLTSIIYLGGAGNANAADNLLRNPEFSYYTPLASKPVNGAYVAGWNSAAYGDIEVMKKLKGFGNTSSYRIVKIKPGKRFWQFINLADLGMVKKGDTLTMSVNGYQAKSSALTARLCLMGIESADGTWTPKDFGDKRTFSCHGRGELIRLGQTETVADSKTGRIRLNSAGLKIDWLFEKNRQSSAAYRNAVGVLVEFQNSSDKPVWIYGPSLINGKKTAGNASRSRPLPEFYRMIPRTMKKLLNNEPVYILTLGSSIDRGSANPRLYRYDENPQSPTYRQPLCNDKPFKPEIVNRPDLKGYVGWFQHYHMYTGRLRLELMKKFNYPVNKILLNVMACDGSSIGESHSGFADYATLALPPNENLNGHVRGTKWHELYPALFKSGKKPAPDLVIFGHGHNEHIDYPDEIAAYEGAVRWFQRHYPEVEFLSCMWIRNKGRKTSISEPMRQLAKYYGFPFIDVGEMIIRLKKSANYYSLAPDGGHPQAGAHYLWFKQLEQAFEVANPVKSSMPQKHLPPRFNPYSYSWDGEMVSFKAPDKRIMGSWMIIEDTAFNVWAKHQAKDKKDVMKINIDGKQQKRAGRGRSMTKRNVRNSTFVYGRLSLGDRHIIEVVGNDAKLVAVDNKRALNRKFYPVNNPEWEKTVTVSDFKSTCGAPYGDKMVILKPGQKMSINVKADAISIAYVDDKNGGILTVRIDGNVKFTQPTNIPFVDSTGNKHYIENRKGITGLKYGEHTVEISAKNRDVRILGLYTYDTRK
ncbi:MAG: SGNH/GDSL hydrolase family protein [Victivallaceae bacterium]|nr:SGNH/GDSL hydrolase family protein [Victivallaceae bacterium]